MLRSNLPRAVCHLRRRRRWRQQDLADAAGVSREAISRMERGAFRGVSIGTAERIVAALDASIDLTVRWHGAELDRTLDAAHARLQEWIARELAELGWLVRVEVSFNHYGDRGRIDILAFHPVARVLLIVEIKTALGDLQETLGRLDVKVRLGTTIAREAGWSDVATVVPMMVVADSRSVRRLVAAHSALFERYGIRGRQARAWLRRPAAPSPSGLLWFLNVSHSQQVTTTSLRRVRTDISRP